MRKLILAAASLACMGGVLLNAQSNKRGGISTKMLSEIQSSYTYNTQDKAIRNALNGTDLNKLAVNADVEPIDGNFSIRVNSKGITNQFSSGRCWLFTGLNVMRAKVIAQYDMGAFEYSEVYPFFWDQLEKSNLFLQGIIDTRDKKDNDQMVEWLFKNPLSDGGTFAGVADIVGKYGLVPSEVMPETMSSKNTGPMAKIIILKLREFGMELRKQAANGASQAKLIEDKTEMLSSIYKILALNLGNPPTEFSWDRKNAKGEVVATEEHTPKSFLAKYGDEYLIDNYVMLMNDPSREYYQTYEIDYDRHQYDGTNWTYINLPVEDIKEMAITSLKDSTMMYFSCDVGKFLDSERGVLDINNYDYASLFDMSFTMDKKDRVKSFASGSSHAMTLMAVNLDDKGNTNKWMVENSWGANHGHNGHLIMTDEWFNEYMFRLVVEKKYVPAKVMKLLNKKPIRLPAWDPMFMHEK
ncbi:C1 family peptidase [Bacteroides propionicifaciens]|uniref:C1 family peptidase n=1 Tax=Bacteroides propionicifaciens TaxID=392838 RepID=UPI00035FA4FA|nr:C1 family peptidase [Bacteroides propionicifaciens]